VAYDTPEKRRASQRKWCAANKGKLAAYQRKWVSANREKVNAQQRARRNADKEKYKERKREWETANREKVRQMKRAEYARNKEKYAAYRKAHRHADYAAEIRRREVLAGRPRPEVCEACGDSGGTLGIVFDHCHANGHFRGWLCSNCNIAIGMAGNDPDRLLRLAAYLKRTAKGTGAQLTLSGL
jgi:hypothetical protein